jgi:hypothetical protein
MVFRTRNIGLDGVDLYSEVIVGHDASLKIRISYHPDQDDYMNIRVLRPIVNPDDNCDEFPYVLECEWAEDTVLPASLIRKIRDSPEI